MGSVDVLYNTVGDKAEFLCSFVAHLCLLRCAACSCAMLCCAHVIWCRTRMSSIYGKEMW